jgi:hypothetical protein
MNEFDNKVELLLKKVEEKKKAIKSAERPQWKTNLSFKWQGNETTNLQVVSDLEELVRMLAHIQGKKDTFDKAMSLVGLKLTYKYNGFSYEDWFSDIMTRINMVQITKTKKELALLEEKLMELQSPELKKTRALAEIEALLN